MQVSWPPSQLSLPAASMQTYVMWCSNTAPLSICMYKFKQLSAKPPQITVDEEWLNNVTTAKPFLVDLLTENGFIFLIIHINLLRIFIYQRNGIQPVIILKLCDYNKWFISPIMTKTKIQHLQNYYFFFKYNSVLKPSLTKLYKISSELCKAKPVADRFQILVVFPA